MKFSFITCTFNRYNLLSKNIESVLQQNFKSFEHYVVDDGSTDNTRLIVKKFKHIKYIRLKKNYGQPGAMFYSKVLFKVNGDYIILLDSDDFLLPDAKDIIIKSINKNKKVWSFSFNIISRYRKKLKFEEKKIYSKLLYYDDHPRFNNGAGYLDFLDVKKKIFYKKFTKHFKSPKYWYTSAADVYFKNNFNEIFLNQKIAYTSFDTNNVTKGHNFEKYAPITLHTRQYIFKNYKNFMQKKYYDYHLKSLFLNQLIFSGYKLKNLKLIFRERDNLLKKINYFIFFLLLLIPSYILFKLKKNIKSFRSIR